MSPWGTLVSFPLPQTCSGKTLVLVHTAGYYSPVMIASLETSNELHGFALPVYGTRGLLEKSVHKLPSLQALGLIPSSPKTSGFPEQGQVHIPVPLPVGIPSRKLEEAPTLSHSLLERACFFLRAG